MIRFASALALMGAPLLALAHEGHGIEGANHWHATDTVGFIAGAAAVAVALIWFGRKK
ncbi:MAG TPA: hypothetical protein VFL64_22635 [Rhizobacter sp.]|nr:hypothetical protein [Rhizobacter sp.]